MTDAAQILVSLLISLTPLVLLVMVVVAVARGRDDEEDDDPGIGTVRRLFLYGGMALALGFAAWGVGTLLAGAFDAMRGEAIVGDRETGLALGLAFTLVGTPAWLLFVFGAARAVRSHPVEQASLLRRTYLALARAVPLIAFSVPAIGIGMELVHDRRIGSLAIATVLVAAGIWLLHERAVEIEPPRTGRTRLLDALYLLFGSALGLGLLALGLGMATAEALRFAYDESFRGAAVIAGPGRWETLLEPLVFAIVGLPIWAWHWFVRARVHAAGAAAVVYLVGFSVIAGVGVALSAAGITLYALLEWFFGVPAAATAVEHFEMLPDALPALLVGVALWGYHRAILRERREALRTRGEPERAYRYLLAGAGLIVLAAGLTRIFAVAFDAVPGETFLVRSDGWWRNPFLLGITLLVIGAPLWARSWQDVQRHAPEAAERASLSRRVYLFAIFGAAVLIALVDLTIVLFQVFDHWLDGSLGAEIVRETRWSMALLLTAGAAGVYHWLILREDRAHEPEVEAVQRPTLREVVLLAPDGTEALAGQLERRLRVRVRTWRRLDVAPAVLAPLTEERLAALEEELRQGSAERVEVLVDADGEVTVLPFRPV